MIFVVLNVTKRPKKFASVYRHMGKQYTLYVEAYSFDHADYILETAYSSNDMSAIDFGDNYTEEEKRFRLRDSHFNGQTEQVVFSFSVP